MTKHRTLVALVTLGAALSGASILAGLRHALGRRHGPEPELDQREADRAKMRAAMGDAVGSIDLNDWPERLRGRPDLPDRDTLRDSVKPIDRPAWHDIRQDRDARG